MKSISVSSGFVLIILLFFATVNEPNVYSTDDELSYETPRFVVGLMVDQMRPDYISRYWDKYGDDGFKRLVGEGFTFTNTHFDYMPTATGAGFASVYTGTTPSVHGAMGNSWYVRELNRGMNVIAVEGYEGVGSSPGYNGNKGPGNMLTTTVGDELRLYTNNRLKVVSISRKDRGAILPAGYTGDAYWYEEETGNFVTITYYRDRLPSWLQEFNDRNLPQEYLSEPWETLLPIDEYIESIEDDNSYEAVHRDQDAPVFPHDLPTRIAEYDYGLEILGGTPFGDKLLLELAVAAIGGESLGTGATPDMLAIGLSATDWIGHEYGPASVEVQDTYMRLDRYLANFLNYLDEAFGKENILLFMTSDHGVVHIPKYLKDKGVPAGYFDRSEIEKLRTHLRTKYGEDFLLAFSNNEVFLDHSFIDENDLDHGKIQREVARFMLSLEGIGGALTAEALSSGQFTRGIHKIVQNGFHQKRSGDVLVWLEPHWIPQRAASTTHGSPRGYDTHAPMHWYGWNIPPGRSSQPVYISDIASTVATFFHSPFPSGNTGNPMNDLMK